jgi:hypothetical protein
MNMGAFLHRVEFLSSKQTRSAGEVGSAAAHHFIRDRRDRSRRGHSQSNACTGAAPVAVPNQGELRTTGVCLSTCHAGNIPDDVVNVQSGTRPPGRCRSGVVRSDTL